MINRKVSGISSLLPVSLNELEGLQAETRREIELRSLRSGEQGSAWPMERG